MGSPRTSVVVRCYNEREHIGKLLHGVFEQTVDDFEVILVDSGSTDGTLEVAQEFDIDDIVYISPEGFSFGRALNLGIEAAAGEFCVIASAHVYPKRRDWIEQLLTMFDEEVALVYGKQRGNEVTTFSEKQIFRRWFPDENIKHQHSPFCNNANAAIRRAVWEEQPYDEELTGLEDVDWAKRAQEDGWEISYAADAEIVHVHDETAREIYNRYRREAFAHRQIVPDRSFSLWDFFKLFTRNTVSDYATAIRARAIGKPFWTIPYFRFLQFYGTYQGFNQEEPLSERLWQRFYYPDRESYPSRHESTDGKTAPREANRRGAGSEVDDEIDYPSDGIPGT